MVDLDPGRVADVAARADALDAEADDLMREAYVKRTQARVLRSRWGIAPNDEQTVDSAPEGA